MAGVRRPYFSIPDVPRRKKFDSRIFTQIGGGTRHNWRPGEKKLFFLSFGWPFARKRYPQPYYVRGSHTFLAVQPAVRWTALIL